MTTIASELVAKGQAARQAARQSKEKGGASMKLAVILTPGEDGYVVAECPTLPGCVSQGSTDQEALENIKEAILGWLEVEAEKVCKEAEAKVVLVEI